MEVSPKSALIMLVLDCSSSLGSQFSTAKSNANNFISTLAGYGNDEKFSAIDIMTYDDIDIFTTLEKDEMVFVKGGTFLMGAQSADASAPNYDSEAWSEESPVHSVTLSDYYIGKYEVTQQLWEYVMKYSGPCADGSTMSAYATDVWLGTNPSSSNGVGNYYPAYYVSWNDIVDIFIPRLNKITGKTFRLPTEAEWEYAARGGNKSKGYKYSGSNTIDDVAWYTGNSSDKTHEVGTKAPNELGIYDMSGNVWEWCSDWFSISYYSSSPTTNPTGPTSTFTWDFYRVRRGGGRYDSASDCRVTYRGCSAPGYRNFSYGFRLVLFTNPTIGGDNLLDEMNKFLRSHRVTDIQKNI
ncbi:MAG: SUMF1/EgtB/PvdO family nonheme iron enzyme [Muribaculaceae bacterium]|nr:SUMF1/EgtB/PvdO family nonheme iron enzyme [Muribaculaceae bacterium]